MSGIYIHIPYCKQRCAYCDFYKEISDDKTRINRFIHALCKEINQQKSYLLNKKIATVYFGGGTPSVLGKEHFTAIFDTLNTYFDIETDAEITLEANPDDLNEEYLALLASLPFNRLSIGIQSFNDNYLKLLNRRHTSEQGKKALEIARKHGFNNISIDLIYALPNQTMDEWKEDLSQAFDLEAEHISSYELSIEKGTEFWKLHQTGKIHEVKDELAIEMYAYMRLIMREQGYETYEISNYAKPGFRSRHNSAYWKFTPYLGLGPSAHSFDGESRQYNIPSEKIYIEKIENDKLSYHKEELSKEELYNDFIMVSLRTTEGISIKKLLSIFGKECYEYCMQQAGYHINNKNLIMDKKYIYLSEKGIMLSDAIIIDLIKTD